MAVEELIDSGQQLMLDRLDLMRLELKEGVDRTVNKAVSVAIATVLGLSGWVALSVAAVLGLAEVMHTAAAALVVGLAQVAAASAFWLSARSRFKKRAVSSPLAVTRATGWNNPSVGAQKP